MTKSKQEPGAHHAEAVLTSTVDQVRIITLNRPEARNAIDSDVSLGVFEALAALDRDDDGARGGPHGFWR